jgi:hypothetical protein
MHDTTKVINRVLYVSNKYRSTQKLVNDIAYLYCTTSRCSVGGDLTANEAPSYK